MSAWMRYFFPAVDPYALQPEAFAVIWWEADYLIRKTKPFAQS